MHPATLVVIVLSAGLASQWLAARLRIPAIVVLIAVGLLLGPVTGVVSLGPPTADLTELIGFGVAIILFEGAMDLRIAEYRSAGAQVRRLTLLGPPLAWTLGACAAHYLGGFDWTVAAVLGAILVVTGPTVIQPLLRQERLKRSTATLLKWEGIVNDPVGVLLAVLAFGYVTTADGNGLSATVASLGSAIAAAAVFGGVGGWLFGMLYQRGAVPFHLKAPMLMGAVLLVFGQVTRSSMRPGSSLSRSWG
ncbi:MAG: cation:proton antiporter [Nostocoides sp.]